MWESSAYTDLCVHRFIPTQIYAYTDLCLHRFMPTQIYAYTDLRVHRFMRTQIYAYSDLCVHRFMRTQIYAYSEFCVLRFMRTQISAYSDLCVHRFMRTQIYSYSEFCVLRFLRTQIYAYSDLCVLRFKRTQIYAYPDLCVLRFMLTQIYAYSNLFGQFRLLRESHTQIFLFGQFHLMWELSTQRYINRFILHKTLIWLYRVFYILFHGCCSCPLYNLCYININPPPGPFPLWNTVCVFLKFGSQTGLKSAVQTARKAFGKLLYLTPQTSKGLYFEFHIKGRIWAQGFREGGVKEEGGSNRRLEKITQWRTLWFVLQNKYYRIRRIIWAWDVARMERREMSTEFFCRNIKERDHLEDLGVNGGIRLKRLLKRPVKALTGFIWLRIEISGRFLWRRHSKYLSSWGTISV